jgi:hypothetical protein
MSTGFVKLRSEFCYKAIMYLFYVIYQVFVSDDEILKAKHVALKDTYIGELTV